MKKCCTCGAWRPEAEYHKDRTRTDGLSPRCKPCKSQSDKKYMEADPVRVDKRKQRSKKWRDENPERARELVKSWKATNKDRVRLLDRKAALKSHYGMTVEEYIEIYNRQGGVCAVCKSSKALVVDHDHSCCSDKPTCGDCTRGLLCDKCNKYLHYIEEYDVYREAATQYLNLMV